MSWTFILLNIFNKPKTHKTLIGEILRRNWGEYMAQKHRLNDRLLFNHHGYGWDTTICDWV